MSVLVQESGYHGDLLTSAVLNFNFGTTSAAGTPTTLAGTPALSVYKDDGTTESTAGITLTVDFDSLTGLNNVKIDTGADGTFYAAGHNYSVVLTAGTVGAVSVVGMEVASFSIENRNVILADGKAHGGTLGASTATLAFSRLVAASQTTDEPAFRLTGNGSGAGLLAQGGSGDSNTPGTQGGAGIACVGGDASTGGNAWSCQGGGGGSGSGGQPGYGSLVTGGFWLDASGAAAGMVIQGGTGVSVLAAAGVALSLLSTDADAVQITPFLSSGSAAAGISVVGAGTGPAVLFGDGTLGAEGLKILAGTGNTNADGVYVAGAGDGNAWRLVASGDGISISAGTKGIDISSTDTAISAISGTALGLYVEGTTGGMGVHNVGLTGPGLEITGSTNSPDVLLSGDGTVGGTIGIDLSQAVPTSNAAETVGDALNAARAQAFGKWTLVGTTLKLFANDGVTVVRTFTLDSATAPTSRT